MRIDMNSPLSWNGAHLATHPDAAAQLAMLNDLQGNILKGHGRQFTSNLFLQFDSNRAPEVRAFISATAGLITTALHQLIQTDLYKKGLSSSSTFYSLLISATGYDALERIDAIPEGEAFRAGMKARPLGDDLTIWDSHFSAPIDAMMLIAAETAILRDDERSSFLDRIARTNGAVRLLNPKHQEDGCAIFNKPDGNGIEHFGYVDGRSQPLALTEDIEQERTMHGGIDKWHPGIPLSQLLVKCPGGSLEVSLGSFFVFRKLEQDVKAFKLLEEKLGRDIALRTNQEPDAIGERFGASVVGRFENGTPVTKFGEEQSPIPKGPVGVLNNFNYSSDSDGLKCPFAGHIRKTNPRGDIPDSKSHLMARRGIPYGTRTDLDNPDPDSKPSRDVGLLFMAYQSSLENQFEFTQLQWANNVQFLKPAVGAGADTGLDPIIGLPSAPSGQQWPERWNEKLTDGRSDDTFSGFVKTKGGEYFFAPSISFLKRM